MKIQFARMIKQMHENSIYDENFKKCMKIQFTRMIKEKHENSFHEQNLTDAWKFNSRGEF